MARTAKAAGDRRSQLLQALEKIDRPGSVCSSGDLPLTMPGLEVDQVGPILLPLDGAQARKLIKQCSQAPFGKGTKTLVDTDVRRVWELDPDRLTLTNPKWSALVSVIVAEVRQALGLERKLTAHLYRLLLYEKGSFFLPHRDGEKLDRMVATLVIALPSRHTGGELIVTHEGRRHRIAFLGAASGHELSYAAFYADCEHEVRPLEAGHRLSLVYNLTVAGSRSNKAIAAPRTTATVDAIGKLLGQWPRAGVQKLAIALDHQYSQAGLTVDTLKGVDRARADVLFDAAEQAGCMAHLALVTHWQNGSAEGGDYDDYSYRSYGWRRRYGDWSEEEDDEGGEDETSSLSGYEMGDVFEEGLSANHWSDRDGKNVAFGEIGLVEQEIVSSQPLQDWPISREEFEGFTGNAGMTLERWYHRAAVVVWPRRNHFQVLCGAGTDTAIAGLEQMVKKWKRSRKSDEPAVRSTCLQFAEAIADTWSPDRVGYFSYREPDAIDRSVFPLALQELDAPELLCRVMEQILPQDCGVQIDRSFTAFCKRHGWHTFEPSLTTVMDASSAATIVRNAALLEVLCTVRDKNAERLRVCRGLADHIVTALAKLDRSRPKRRLRAATPADDSWDDESLDDDWTDQDWRNRQIDRTLLVRALIKSLVAVDADKPLARLIDHALASSSKYDLTDAHLKAIFDLESWLVRRLQGPNRAVSRWLEHCRRELQKRTKQAPTAPADFRRADELSCKCGDCRELSRFLVDPHQPVLRLPLAKKRRQHLHQQIDAAGCDLTHVTTRKGRPFTLVCTKTTASYDAACKVFIRDQQNLKRLLTIEKTLGRRPPSTARKR